MYVCMYVCMYLFISLTSLRAYEPFLHNLLSLSLMKFILKLHTTNPIFTEAILLTSTVCTQFHKILSTRKYSISICKCNSRWGHQYMQSRIRLHNRLTFLRHFTWQHFPGAYWLNIIQWSFSRQFTAIPFAGYIADEFQFYWTTIST
jgi:hypothetical protein